MADLTTQLQRPAGPETPKSTRRGHPWLTLISVALGIIMVGLDGSVVAIANPRIAADLGASLSDLQWITNAYLLTLGVLLIPAGKLGDRYGRRLIFLVGVTGFALASLGIGVIGSTTGVIGFRVLQGAFGAMLMPNSLAILRGTFPPEKLNMAIGIWGGASAVSVAVGPIVGGLLVENVSWQSVFFVNLPIAAIALALGGVVLAESRSRAEQAADLPGLALLAAGLFALVFGLIKAQEWGWASGRTIGFLIAGILLLVAFAMVESRTRLPLLPMRLFRDRSLSIGTATVMIGFLGMYGVLFFMTLYLQNVHGYSPVQAGLKIVPLSVAMMVGSPVGGMLTGRIGPRLPLAAGLALIGLALLLMTGLGADSSSSSLVLPFVMVGIGLGLVITASAEVIVGNAPIDDAGVASGLQSTAMQVGGVMGTSILGSVLTARVGSVLFDKLTAAGVPAATATELGGAKELVGQGVAPSLPGAPAQVQAAVVSGSHEAFMIGLHTSMLIGAVLALAAAAGALFVRPGERPAGQTAPVH
ncbi:MAG TPA: MFS transporter [Solirubrobacterales bacterium]|nr:MFS transporter [Solirubrobacterales bacterium]